MSDSSSKSSPTANSEAESDEVDPDSFVLREVPHTETETVCKLCYRPAQPPGSKLRLGTLYEFGYCTAHLFCLMFSANLNQRGEDHEGINGFRVDDIVKEWRRGSQLKCIYCKKKYATLGCGKAGCKKAYHLPCGLENGSLQQFHGKFESFCSVHKPLQTPFHNQKKYGAKVEMREECGCCTMPLDDGECEEFLWTPCCGGWFHRECVALTAENAGSHFFKCPLCNNKKDFTEEMLKFGVFVPDRDADWENGDAFADQLHRHDTCDAPVCLCPSGRKFDDEDTDWEIMLCVLCGAQGIHVLCGGLDKARPRWKCPMCKPVVATMSNKPISVFTRVKRNQDPPDKEFTRAVFENLSFKVNTESYEINVGLHKNRKDPKDPVVVSFKVEGVPAFDVPKSVKVHKTESRAELEKVIPCPNDDCEELLSRLEFREHCLKHKEEAARVTRHRGEEEDQPEGHGQVETEEGDHLEDIKSVSQTTLEKQSAIENFFNHFSPDQPEGYGQVETEEGDHLEDIKSVSQTTLEKQSAIENFFNHFSPDRPNFDQPPRKKIKLDKARPRLLSSQFEPESEGCVISSPVGYFKVDQVIHPKSPVRKVLGDQSQLMI